MTYNADNRTGRVAIVGAGVAGLTVAHELAERGFDVDVYERHEIAGGKCRSWFVAGTGKDGRADLPAEIGPRVVAAGYQHLGQTLARIPRPQGGTLLDNLTPGRADSTFDFLWEGEKASLPTRISPISLLRVALRRPGSSIRFLKKLTARDYVLLTSKVFSLMTHGPERAEELEDVTTPEFFRTHELSPNGRLMFEFAHEANTMPSSNCGARAMVKGHWYFTAIDPLLRGRRGLGWRRAAAFANGPINEMLFDPWVDYLRGLGVRFHFGCRAISVSMSDGQIEHIQARDSGGREVRIDADHFVLATPHDKTPELLSDELIEADPALGRIKSIGDYYLGFMQVNLRKGMPSSVGGWALMSSPWAMGHFSSNLWDRDFASTYGDGAVVEQISVDCAAWDTPGIVYGKPACECTPAELLEEFRAQARRDAGDPNLLSADDIHSYTMCPALSWDDEGRFHHDEPMWAQSPGCWRNQPDAVTQIPNLFLAASYVNSSAGRDCMDCASEAAKAAANGVLAASGATFVPVQAGYEPPKVIQWLWRWDNRRYRRGRPNIFDCVVSSAPLPSKSQTTPDVLTNEGEEQQPAVATVTR